MWYVGVAASIVSLLLLFIVLLFTPQLSCACCCMLPVPCCESCIVHGVYRASNSNSLNSQFAIRNYDVRPYSDSDCDSSTAHGSLECASPWFKMVTIVKKSLCTYNLTPHMANSNLLAALHTRLLPGGRACWRLSAAVHACSTLSAARSASCVSLRVRSSRPRAEIQCGFH
jgi:hypothetical protein